MASVANPTFRLATNRPRQGPRLGDGVAGTVRPSGDVPKWTGRAVQDLEDPVTRAAQAIASLLAPHTDDQRRLAVLEAQSAVDELGRSLQTAMQVVRATQAVRDTYQEVLASVDRDAAVSVLDKVERVEAALLAALVQPAEPSQHYAGSEAWIAGAF